MRDGGTDLLDLWFDRLGFYDRVAPNLLTLLETTRASRVVDFVLRGRRRYAADATQGARRRQPSRGRRIESQSERGSDRAGRRARRSSHRYRAESIDAMTGDDKLNGIRTRQGGGSRPTRCDAGANGRRCVDDAGRSLARSTLRR
jgi:hypothetical protein